jgi:hypothetical protein
VPLRVLDKNSGAAKTHRLVIEQRTGEGRKVVAPEVGVAHAIKAKDAACDSGKPYAPNEVIDWTMRS